MFKNLKDGVTPTRRSKYSACVDLYASKDVVVGAGETKVIGIGICIDLDWLKKKYKSNQAFIKPFTIEEYNKAYPEVWEIFLKSHYLQLTLSRSLGKKSLILPNGVMVIDLDYKDEIKMIVHNPIKTVSNVSLSDNPDYPDMVTEVQIRPSTGGSYTIKKGDKIAQITLLEHKSYLFGVESEGNLESVK